MKKTLSLLIVVVMLLIMSFSLGGCSPQEVMVESLLEINSDYSGHRKITITFPLETDVDELSDKLTKRFPLADSKNSKFEYLGVAEDGHAFVMDIVFFSKQDYLSQIQTLVGHKVTSYLSQPDTVLTKGTRMIEDFDSSDLIGWVVDESQLLEETQDMEFDYDDSVVKIGSEKFKTGSKIDITQLKGKAIDSISIETTNLKDGTFDRTITFLIPEETYKDNTQLLEQYFKTNTSPQAQYCDFSGKGDSWEYKVIYKGISLEQMNEYTAMLLQTEDHSVFYGDKNNESTPLSEGLVFEETLSTGCFVDEDGNTVGIEYSYALPTNTRHSDGTIYTNGSWKTEGMWQDGVYSVKVNNDAVSFKIPDGIEYAINGIRFDLEVLDDNKFVRTTELLYSKTQGADGMKYAEQFFKSKGAKVTTGKDDENLICKVVCTGDAQQITDELVEYFGSGNFLAYKADESAFALSSKTKLTDYIDLKGILNSTNANRPMTYTVHSSCKENIVELMCDGVESVQNDSTEDVLEVQVRGGVGTVVYNGSNPDVFNITIYLVICAGMLVLTIAVIVIMLAKQRDKNPVEYENVSYAPNQTTTFSIAELTALSDNTDKKLREEIDKDINEKIENDRIIALAKELKEKEVEQLIKMVYGENAEIDTDGGNKTESAPYHSADDEQDKVD